jgi:hypothetical protein
LIFRVLTPIAPDLVNAIRPERNATVAAVQHAQARVAPWGKRCSEARDELGPVTWETWLQHRCPAPAVTARHYAKAFKRLKEAA